MNLNIGRLAFVALSGLVMVASALVAASGLADMLDIPGKRDVAVVTPEIKWSFGQAMPVAGPNTLLVWSGRISSYPLRVSGSPPDAGPDR